MVPCRHDGDYGAGALTETLLRRDLAEVTDPTGRFTRKCFAFSPGQKAIMQSRGTATPGERSRGPHCGEVDFA
ncbi:hypothetical protein Ade02nite_03360 [Paractinoplanes deccanensis]|uniref:Uncharacterized protein n=1 Tax=Paractinoplanes deccanensis TaxID=113561 RepID=A0ABQ3XVB8_9ACTN|nr:hypothetical protein Ade02nite_03360 [Actinoplanes deccanensis]